MRKLEQNLTCEFRRSETQLTLALLTHFFEMYSMLLVSSLLTIV